MPFEIKEEWYPMPPNMGPPLPRSMQVYWPWVKRPPAPPEKVPIYACPYCEAEFVTEIELYAHIREAHPAQPPVTIYMCPHCGARFDSLTDLQEHMARVHPPAKVYTCPQCGARFSTEAQLNYHIQTMHPAPPEAPPAPPPKADIRNLDFVATKGTYEIGDRVPFSCTYEYKGKAQGGQLVISLGTGVYPTFSPVVNYSPMAVSFAEAMDWTPMSFSGTFLLNEALEPDQLYNTQAKLQTLEDPTQIIDTDWGVIRITEVAPPPPPPAVARFYMPPTLNIREEGPYNGLYKVTFSTEITNKGDATGREQLTWGSNYLTASPYLPGYGPWEEEVSRFIELRPGESYDWSYTYDEVFDYYSGYFTCKLFGGWEGNNSSVGTFTAREAALPPPPPPPAPKEYGLTTTVSPSGAGTVTGAGTYTAGTYATCDATPASGYEFDHWGGDASGTSPSTRILIDRGKRAIAYFKKKAVPAYKLSILVRPMAAGWVKKEPDKASYTYGETVKLTARTAPGYRFSSWTVDGEWAGYSTTLTLMVTKDLEVVAHFGEI